MMALTYLAGREHGVRDNVQMDRRRKLQQLRSDLRYQATPDPLTGLYNRLKFSESLASEIARSARDGTPLTLILYDIDHF